ncbi:hypothetical protein GH810_08495 [Acetobacterium paludosum]|uniref:DUF4153 domain-containing protein n=1 Tax=Acetobacterium paludosum TaxID=52693 RepID=A0A923HVB7_9FIRM|nr:permease prefix domain 1-containing protein [Acetobacterium paludosum]MBC3888347.1 hypothetical protein [Acetobacterium paludosum]
MFDLAANIRSWSDLLRAKGDLSEPDIIELENHLKDEIDDLITIGLSTEEAFLISVKRMGNVHAISKEYSKVSTENLWKHLMLNPDGALDSGQNRKYIAMVIIFSLVSGTLFKLPELFGLNLLDSENGVLFFKNISFFILPFVAAFFLIKHQSPWKTPAVIGGIFALAWLLINLYPTYSPNDTEFLTALHLPLFLWLITGIAYMGINWKTTKARMNFIRFTGESVIYGTLIFCGIIVLAMFIQAMFFAIQINASWFIQNYLIVYGASSAAMITIYLVETKKSVVENFAPILAKIFSPLFLLVMLVFLGVMIGSSKSPFIERDYLIAFDFMLALVLGLVIYVISARNPHERNTVFDYINLALILTALIIDGIALSAIVFRLSAYGLTPNKVAALGENLVLLVNLAGLAWLYIRFFLNKFDFKKIEVFQTSYLYVYAIWFGMVAFLLPILFGFQ